MRVEPTRGSGASCLLAYTVVFPAAVNNSTSYFSLLPGTSMPGAVPGIPATAIPRAAGFSASNLSIGSTGTCPTTRYDPNCRRVARSQGRGDSGVLPDDVSIHDVPNGHLVARRLHDLDLLGAAATRRTLVHGHRRARRPVPGAEAEAGDDGDGNHSRKEIAPVEREGHCASGLVGLRSPLVPSRALSYFLPDTTTRLVGSA